MFQLSPSIFHFLYNLRCFRAKYLGKVNYLCWGKLINFLFFIYLWGWEYIDDNRNLLGDTPIDFGIDAPIWATQLSLGWTPPKGPIESFTKWLVSKLTSRVTSLSTSPSRQAVWQSNKGSCGPTTSLGERETVQDCTETRPGCSGEQLQDQSSNRGGVVLQPL